MIAKKTGDKIEIQFQYDPILVGVVKSFPGRIYNARTRSWFIPLQNSAEAVRKLKMYRFTVDQDVLDYAEQDTKRAQEAEALAVMDDTTFETPLPLRPYQKVGAAFLYNIGSGLLADDCGLGKTIQSLAVCVKSNAQKVLIFCPASVKWQWHDEIKRFIPGAKVCVIEGNKKERDICWQKEARFYIANYELLLRDAIMQAINWDIIIADEATKISNPMAKQSKAIKKLRAKRRIAMTGTPVSNRANEIWNLVDFISPGAMGGYWGFLQRYCLKNQWGGIFGYQNMDELAQKLKRYMIRRLKKDVLKELPDKVITDVPFVLSVEEKDLYKKLKKEILFEIQKEDISKIETPMSIQYTLVKMTRLRQLADSMELLGEKSKSSKLEALKELLQENIQDGRKAIIFTQFAQMADILERELKDYKPAKITGNIKEEYHDVVEKFNTDEECKILIMTSAGQFGLNIQRASIIFHYDQEWSLAKMQQREGRAHRMGQKDTVMVYNLLARGTLDYYVQKVLHAKAELSGQILGDKPISMEDIKNMLNYE